MSAPALRVLAALGGLLLASEVLQVSGIKVLTAGEVEAVNGTDAWLKCTFETSEPVSELSVTVSWTFRPLGQGKEESVFYYHQKPYPISEGRFRKRVDWSGNIMAKDASITIRDVKFSYNGTFICQVKNLPDVHGLAGEVRLKVVASVVKHRRKKREEVAELEFQQRARKDPTMCHPAEAVYLCMPEKTKSDSDAVISDPSCKNLSLEEENEKLSDDATDGMISAETFRNPSLEKEEDNHFDDATDKILSTPILEEETEEHSAADGMISDLSSNNPSLMEVKEKHGGDTTNGIISDPSSKNPSIKEGKDENSDTISITKE
ncbi:uncharacterized protein LOC108932336 isoform X2 [Scleropages formosus]|uniref:uncharacterized protein LOC108932336 isoform X2 n=1 Tax=Scleropages formosus TaxID=113540 RepID=UPI0008782F43|nr:uncharacterized protein LOC108932336 isoform X2 [Scleropages formosus]